jgi:hypothetical protein
MTQVFHWHWLLKRSDVLKDEKEEKIDLHRCQQRRKGRGDREHELGKAGKGKGPYTILASCELSNYPYPFISQSQVLSFPANLAKLKKESKCQ